MNVFVSQLIGETTYPVGIHIPKIDVLGGCNGSSITADNDLSLHGAVRDSLVARSPDRSHFLSLAGLDGSIFPGRGLNNLIDFVGQSHHGTGIVRPVDIKAPI